MKSCAFTYNLAKTSGSLLSLEILFFCYLATAQAGQVSLAWDPSSSPNVGGYRLYYGQTSGNYAVNVDVGNQTSYTLSSLQEGTTYYFAVKAYDNTTRTIESGFSNEVSATITLLLPGLNLIHPGSGSLTCQELLNSLGTPEEVDSFYRLDAPTQRFERCNPQAGVNFAIRLGEGYMVLMRKAWQTPIAPSPTCPEFNLSAGVNLIDHPKPPENLTCFGLLEALGTETVSTIQRYDTETGRFESCTFFSTAGNTSQPAGVNFPIIAGEGYLLHMRMPSVVSLPGCGD